MLAAALLLLLLPLPLLSSPEPDLKGGGTFSARTGRGPEARRRPPPGVAARSGVPSSADRALPAACMVLRV